MPQALISWLGRGFVGPDAPLIVACSGGADSLALALAAPAVVRDRELIAATVDHQLQAGSAQRAAAVADLLCDHGFRRVEVLTVVVGGKGGPEGAARDARLGALRALAGRIAAETGVEPAVLLAHTADDQAETVLLGLGRGSGPRSIAGMRPWRSPWGRPLLGVRRVDTEAACAAAGLAPWQDPHNLDPAFTRVRLRRDVMPLLDEVLGGGVVPALARTADLMADDLAALDALAAHVLEVAVAADGSLGIAEVVDHPAAIRRRVLRSWAGQGSHPGSGGNPPLTADRLHRPLTADHLCRLDDLLTAGCTGQSVRLPGRMDVVRRRDRLVLALPTRFALDRPGSSRV